MLKSFFTRPLAAVFLLIAALLTQTAAAQDPAQLDPHHVQLLMENERVRVLRLSVPPREAIPPYEVPPTAEIFFTDGRLRYLMTARSNNKEEQIPARAVRFSRGGKRGLENLGDTTLEIVAIEFKDKLPKKNPGFPGDRDPAILDPGQFKQELVNEWCRVIDFHVGPREAVPMSLHPGRVVIALSDVNYRLIRPKYGTTIVDAKAGEISWRPAELAAIESSSDHIVEELFIEPRPYDLGPYAPRDPVKPVTRGK
jgi:hypothetical protein